MLLRDIFSPAVIKISLESEDKDEVFEELVDVIATAHRLSERQGILDAVRDREAKMSTGIREGIAVPHGKTDAVTRVFGAIGVSAPGVDYDALDGKPVHLIFMLVSPADQSGPHLKMLRSIAVLLEHPKFADDLMHSRSADELYRHLISYENTIRIEE